MIKGINVIPITWDTKKYNIHIFSIIEAKTKI